MTDDPGSRCFLVSVAHEGGDWEQALPEAEDLAERSIAAVLEAVPRAELPQIQAGGQFEVSLLLADDAVLRRLNRDYRGRDSATNVLAFPNLEPTDLAAGGTMPVFGDLLPLGDLALALETLLREAGAQGKAPADHYSHLVVHGTLHLLGYDHEVEAEAEAMERLEQLILGDLGIADPYRLSEEEKPPPESDFRASAEIE